MAFLHTLIESALTGALGLRCWRRRGQYIDSGSRTHPCIESKRGGQRRIRCSMLTAEDTSTALTLGNACIFHCFAFFAVIITIIVRIVFFGSVWVIAIIFGVFFGVFFFRIIIRVVFGIVVTLILFSTTSFRFFGFFIFLLFGCRRATSEKMSKNKCFLCHFRLLSFQVNV